MIACAPACSSGDDDSAADSAGGNNSGSDAAADGELGETPGWESLHAAIFKPSCALSACHDGPKGMVGLSFETAEGSYAALIGNPPRNGAAAADGYELVAPGEPGRSFLLRKVSKAQDVLAKEAHGAPMPVGNLPQLGPKSLAAVQRWIADGAPMKGGPVDADFVPPPPADNYIECDATDEAGMQACFPAVKDPKSVMRLFTPPLTVAAGTEIQLCTVLAEPLAQEIFLTGADGKQFGGGHHIALYTAAAALPPGIIDCDEVDMSALRFVVGAGGVGGLNTSLPSGLALRVPKGQQLVIQSHYINTRPEAVQVMDAVDIHLTEKTDSTELADSFAMIDSDFEIPPFTFGYRRVKECEITAEMDLVLLIGHTHDFGVLYRLEHMPKGGEVQELYYSTDGPTLRDNPEVKVYEEPLHLKPGDKLRMTCEWNNDTAHPVGWPEEMCVAFTYYTPGDGWLICDSEDTTPQKLGGGEGDGCLEPGAQGNELGVGTYCTVDGSECADNGAANFCLASFSATNNYCSVILCSSDEECGTGAKCIEDGPGSACILDACE